MVRAVVYLFVFALVLPPSLVNAAVDQKVQVAFFQAINSGDLSRAKLLSDRGASVHLRDRQGRTPLLIAVGLGDLAMTRFLISKGADSLTLDLGTGAAPLNRAAQSGTVDIAKLLLENGAAINHQAMLNGHTALLDAVFYRKTELVRYLIKNGADIEVKNHLGLNAMDWAERQAIPAIIESISEQSRKNETEYKNAEPLFEAARSGDSEAVKKAIASKLNVNQKGRDGLTALMDASRKGHLETVKVLLHAGADPNSEDRVMRSNAGHKAAFFGHTEVLEQLIRNGLKLDAVGPYNGYTALHDAVLQNFAKTVRLLICSGARTDLKGHDGKTPFDLAKDLGRIEIERTLRLGCRPNDAAIIR